MFMSYLFLAIFLFGAVSSRRMWYRYSVEVPDEPSGLQPPFEEDRVPAGPQPRSGQRRVSQSRPPSTRQSAEEFDFDGFGRQITELDDKKSRGMIDRRTLLAPAPPQRQYDSDDFIFFDEVYDDETPKEPVPFGPPRRGGQRRVSQSRPPSTRQSSDQFDTAGFSRQVEELEDKKRRSMIDRKALLALEPRQSQNDDSMDDLDLLFFGEDAIPEERVSAGSPQFDPIEFQRQVEELDDKKMRGTIDRQTVLGPAPQDQPGNDYVFVDDVRTPVGPSQYAPQKPSQYGPQKPSQYGPQNPSQSGNDFNPIPSLFWMLFG